MIDWCITKEEAIALCTFKFALRTSSKTSKMASLGQILCYIDGKYRVLLLAPASYRVDAQKGTESFPARDLFFFIFLQR